MKTEEKLNKLKTALKELNNNALEEQKKPLWNDGYMCWEISDQNYQYETEKEVLLLKIEIEELKLKLKEL